MTTETKISELPILFKSDMVRVILAGRKTQTRRIIKGAPLANTAYCLGVHKGVWGIHEDVEKDGGVWRGKCPHGQPGHRFWVRETWAPCIGGPCEPGNPVLYRADQMNEYDQLRWRPSIFMPRWASRITLEITDIRVQRVQDISEEDALAEGIERTDWEYSCEPYRNYKHPCMAPGMNCSTAKMSFATLWDSINSKRGFSWDSNPFIWAISFRQLKGVE